MNDDARHGSGKTEEEREGVGSADSQDPGSQQGETFENNRHQINMLVEKMEEDKKAKDASFDKWCKIFGCLLILPLAIVFISAALPFVIPVVGGLILFGLAWLGVQLLGGGKNND